MSEPSSNWKARCRMSGFSSCAVLLIIAMLVCSAVLLPIAFWIEGFRGVIAASTAALICLTSGLTGLVVTSLKIPNLHAFHRMLLAMAFRLFPPLIVCMLLALKGNGPEYFGFVCYLLVFYMVTLSIETYLSVRWIRSQAC